MKTTAIVAVEKLRELMILVMIYKKLVELCSGATQPAAEELLSDR